jgi:hypothetical protein
MVADPESMGAAIMANIYPYNGLLWYVPGFLRNGTEAME